MKSARQSQEFLRLVKKTNKYHNAVRTATRNNHSNYKSNNCATIATTSEMRKTVIKLQGRGNHHSTWFKRTILTCIPELKRSTLC